MAVFILMLMSARTWPGLRLSSLFLWISNPSPLGAALYPLHDIDLQEMRSFYKVALYGAVSPSFLQLRFENLLSCLSFSLAKMSSQGTSRR